MIENYIIAGGNVLLPEGLKHVDIEIRDGVISGIGQKIAHDGSHQVINAEGELVLPGFIDIHTNGIAGFDLTNGDYDLRNRRFLSNAEAYAAGIDRALRKYAERGVTRAILTSMASPIEELKRAFGFVHAYTVASASSPWKDVLGGLYIEGTFMKLADYSGAHNPDYFNKPSVSLFDRLQEAAGGIIKIVNVVPEWGDAAIKLIEYMYSRGIVCAAGHTGASGSQYGRAMKAGTKLAIHFLNGPTGSSFKPFEEGGAVESVLRASNLFVEVITDGYHVDKSYVMDTISRKGPDKIVIVTDSMFVTCLDEIETFSIFGVDGKVNSNRDFVEVASKPNTLFGSLLTMDVAFSNILNWMTNPVEGVWRDIHEPFSLDQAIAMASGMCSKNPATVLGIFEPASEGQKSEMRSYTGSIEIGKSADLLVARLDRPDGKYKLKIEKVYVKGREI